MYKRQAQSILRPSNDESVRLSEQGSNCSLRSELSSCVSTAEEGEREREREGRFVDVRQSNKILSKRDERSVDVA